MLRNYHEPVDVRHAETEMPGATEGEPPGMFVWRGRLYLVRSALRRRSMAGWRAVCAAATDGSAALAAPPAPGQVIWQVEASAGRELGVETFELAEPPEAGSSWVLLRSTVRSGPTWRRTP